MVHPNQEDSNSLAPHPFDKNRFSAGFLPFRRGNHTKHPENRSEWPKRTMVFFTLNIFGFRPIYLRMVCVRNP